MKLEVGQFVRTKDGLILKINDIEDIYTTDNIFIGMCIYDNEGHFINDVEIIKASFEPTDLIEVGDIITFKNKKEVYKVISVPNEEFDNEYFYLEFNYIERYGVEDIRVSIKEMEKYIYSICTKECFESMSYKGR